MKFRTHICEKCKYWLGEKHVQTFIRAPDSKTENLMRVLTTVV